MILESTGNPLCHHARVARVIPAHALDDDRMVVGECLVWDGFHGVYFGI